MRILACIDMNAVVSVTPSRKWPTTFTLLFSDDRKYHLRALGMDDARDWISSLDAFIEGSHDSVVYEAEEGGPSSKREQNSRQKSTEEAESKIYSEPTPHESGANIVVSANRIPAKTHDSDSAVSLRDPSDYQMMSEKELEMEVNNLMSVDSKGSEDYSDIFSRLDALEEEMVRRATVVAQAEPEDENVTGNTLDSSDQHEISDVDNLPLPREADKVSHDIADDENPTKLESNPVEVTTFKPFEITESDSSLVANASSGRLTVADSVASSPNACSSPISAVDDHPHTLPSLQADEGPIFAAQKIMDNLSKVFDKLHEAATIASEEAMEDEREQAKAAMEQRGKLRVLYSRGQLRIRKRYLWMLCV